MKTTDGIKYFAVAFIGLAIVVVGLVAVFAGGMLTPAAGTITQQDRLITALESDEPEQNLVELGRQSTVYLNSFEGPWSGVDSKTEVYPVYTIVDGYGTKVVNDAGANSSATVSTGDTGIVYCTGAAYYCDSVDYTVRTETTMADDIQAYTAVATSDLVITCYDGDTPDTALTADDHANNTADYNGGSIGNDETNQYFCKLKVNTADKVFRLGAIMTYYCGDEIDNFKMEENDWELANLPPEGDLKKTFNLADDTEVETACSIKHVYTPVGADYIELQEWDDTGKLSFVLNAASTGPSANGDSYMGVIYVDYGCEQDKSGNVVCDWYRHDENSDVDDIGISEGLIASGFNGLDVGVAIEPQ